MNDKIYLDKSEQEIEDNFEFLNDVSNMDLEISMLQKSAYNHLKKNKSITLRINEIDLETVKIKASILGVPYQTYITMLIHKDAISSS